MFLYRCNVEGVKGYDTFMIRIMMYRRKHFAFQIHTEGTMKEMYLFSGIEGMVVMHGTVPVFTTGLARYTTGIYARVSHELSTYSEGALVPVEKMLR